MGIKSKKMERKLNADEMTDREVLEMVAHIFGVGDEQDLATAYSEH